MAKAKENNTREEPIEIMTDKFRNKYRIPSVRLQNWDYGLNAAYFATICSRNKVCFFGCVERCKIQLSEIGKIADVYWKEIPDHFPFVRLGEFVVMPNHIHGIVIIDKPDKIPAGATKNGATNAAVETRQCLVSTIANIDTDVGKNRFQNQGKNTLSSIIGWYKSIVAKNSRKINPDFKWQPNYFEHIIR